MYEVYLRQINEVLSHGLEYFIPTLMNKRNDIFVLLNFWCHLPQLITTYQNVSYMRLYQDNNLEHLYNATPVVISVGDVNTFVFLNLNVVINLLSVLRPIFV